MSLTSGAGHKPEVTMNVSDVMTRRVISISPETSIIVAIKLMLKHHISGLPVIDNHAKLVGILTEGDFLVAPKSKPNANGRFGSTPCLGPQRARLTTFVLMDWLSRKS
jgi:CBS domain-containing protein